jgi:hypothetical protein
MLKNSEKLKKLNDFFYHLSLTIIKNNIKMISESVYYTHDNGSRPFKVIISKNHVKIFAEKTGDSEIEYAQKPFYEGDVQKVFIGLSPLNSMTSHSRGHGPNFDGNSVLLHENELNYVYVGESVKRFQAITPIVQYVSPVGNNDVPYPYAIDKLNNYYLMIENVVLNSAHMLVEEPYNYYYHADLITDDIGCVPPVKPMLGYIQNIKEYWEEYWDYGVFYGMQRWTWRFQPDYMHRAYNLKNAYVIYEDGTRQDLNPEAYISIMKKAEARMGVIRTLEATTLVARKWV